MSRYSENYQFDTSNNNPFIEIPEVIPGEYWTNITENVIPGILPYYAISNYGRILHKFTKSFMKTSWDGPGYRIAILRTVNGAKTFRVHRLVMLTFRYFPGCENLVVDHKNGNKTENCIDVPVYNYITGRYYLYDNLRWTTQQENILAAIDLGLKPRKSGKFLTEEIVKEICRLLQENNLTTSEIGEVTGTNKGVVENILYRRSWKHISENYEFPKKRVITDDIINSICKDIQSGKDAKSISIARKVGIDIVKGIKYRRIHTDISKDYNF